VAFENDKEIRDRVDELIPVPSQNQLFTPFLTVIASQLFAHYIALAKGEGVDQPCKLAKSVTVE